MERHPRLRGDRADKDSGKAGKPLGKEEPDWELKGGMADLARQSSEAAWAMGLHTFDSARLRLQSNSKVLQDNFQAICK